MATISGSADNDVLSGSGPGTIEGLGGADRITFSTFGYALGDEVLLDGGSGNDFISSFVTNTSGGAVPTGTMTVLGGDGDDTILTMGAIGRSVDAGAGNDLVLIGVGGTPTDHFVTGATGSVITLGAGADTLSINSLNYTGAPSIVTDFDPAQDRIVLNDVAVFGSGVPELKVGNAFVNGYLRLVKSGADTKLQVDRDGGGNGFVDAIVFRNIAPAAFTDVAGFNVAGGGTRGYVVNATSAGIFTFGDRIQVVTRGGAGNDTITGTAFMDFLSGERGDDVLNGGSGDDVLTDDFGKNVLKGGSGNDQITSHGIDDQQFGGAGNDTLAYSAISRTSLGGVQARLDGGDGDDRLTIDSTLVTTRLIGGSGNDTIEIVFGLVGDSVISGGTGDDQITVTNGFSTLLLGSAATA